MNCFCLIYRWERANVAELHVLYKKHNDHAFDAAAHKREVRMPSAAKCIPPGGLRRWGKAVKIPVREQTTMMQIEERIRSYWTARSHDFGEVRKNELENDMGRRWLEEIERHLPTGRELRILDVGTGTGFFAILLAQAGHRTEGIDLTPSMLDEARRQSAALGLNITYKEMDAQALSYDDGSFDAVISRNLTWTLPDPEQAYREWARVLRPGGVLLNFDADYAAHVRSMSAQNRQVAADSPYGHIGMTDALQKENDEITLAVDTGKQRPDWDLQVLEKLGFSKLYADREVGERILGVLDLEHAPMFGIIAKKPQSIRENRS